VWITHSELRYQDLSPLRILIRASKVVHVTSIVLIMRSISRSLALSDR